MKKLLMLAMLAIIVAAFAAPQALAADDEGKTKFTGEFRSRFEYNDNYLDFTNDKDWENYFGGSDAKSYWPYRFRLGVEHQFSDNVKVYGEIQNAGHFGNTFNYYGYYEGGGLFNYYLQPMHAMDEYPVRTSINDPAFGENYYYYYPHGRQMLLYQGYVELGKLGSENLSLRLGRQEQTLGTQLLMGNNEFYNGISFDGAHLMWHPEKYGVDAFYYKLNESYYASTDANLFGLTGKYDMSKSLGTVEGYVLVYQNLADTEYLPTPSWLAWNDMKLTTYGVRWGRMVKSADDMKDGAFDWNIEFALQSGDSLYNNGGYEGGGYKYDFGGSIIEGWFGWNFATGSGRSRVHVGTLMASGQKEDETEGPNGMDYKGFIPLFGNNWAYNRLGDLDLFDMTDINDINIGYSYMTENDKHKFGIMLHSFGLAEDITITDPVSDEDKSLSSLGEELDLRYTMKINDKTSFSAGYAYLMPGEVFDKGLSWYTYDEDPLPHITSADSVSRLWAQVRVRF